MKFSCSKPLNFDVYSSIFGVYFHYELTKLIRCREKTILQEKEL